MSSFLDPSSLKLDEAKEKLIELNNLLQEKCQDLSLTLDYYSDIKDKKTLSVFDENLLNKYDGVVLCLNHNNNCISSLTFNKTMFDEEIEIASRTDSKYEGRQFNKLLRAVIFVIGKFIKTYNNTPIRIISSVAENPISAY